MYIYTYIYTHIDICACTYLSIYLYSERRISVNVDEISGLTRSGWSHQGEATEPGQRVAIFTPVPRHSSLRLPAMPCVSIRQHSAYVSIRQHSSAYVSIRQTLFS